MTANDFMRILDSKPLAEVLKEYPIGWDFLATFRLNNLAADLPFSQALLEVDDEVLAEFGLDRLGAL